MDRVGIWIWVSTINPSHFPIGFANGRKNASFTELQQQSTGVKEHDQDGEQKPPQTDARNAHSQKPRLCHWSLQNYDNCGFLKLEMKSRSKSLGSNSDQRLLPWGFFGGCFFGHYIFLFGIGPLFSKKKNRIKRRVNLKNKSSPASHHQ